MASTSILASVGHRQPTRWSLYRPLLQLSSALPLPQQHRNALQGYIRDEFKRNRNLKSVETVKRKVVEGEQLLDDLERASTSDYYLNRFRQLASFLAAQRTRSSRPPSPPKPSSPPPKPKLRPSILHATQFHPPMPRLRPQPLGTSMMIFNRRRASQKRFDRVVLAKELAALGKAEDAFEEALGVRRAGEGSWSAEWMQFVREAKGKEVKEYRRNDTRIPRAMQARAVEANKQREQGRLARSRRSAFEPNSTVDPS